MYVIVIVMAYQLLFQRFKELALGQMPGCFEPRFHALQRTFQLRWRCSSFYTDGTLAIFEPINLKPQEREGLRPLATWVEPTEPYDLCFARFYL